MAKCPGAAAAFYRGTIGVFQSFDAPEFFAPHIRLFRSMLRKDASGNVSLRPYPWLPSRRFTPHVDDGSTWYALAKSIADASAKAAAAATATSATPSRRRKGEGKQQGIDDDAKEKEEETGQSMKGNLTSAPIVAMPPPPPQKPSTPPRASTPPNEAPGASPSPFAATPPPPKYKPRAGPRIIREADVPFLQATVVDDDPEPALLLLNAKPSAADLVMADFSHFPKDCFYLSIPAHTRYTMRRRIPCLKCRALRNAEACIFSKPDSPWVIARR